MTTLNQFQDLCSPCISDQEWGICWLQAWWSSKKFYRLVTSHGWTCRVERGYGGWNSAIINKQNKSLLCVSACGTQRPFFSVFKYLPSWFGHLSEVREVVLDPHVDLLQGHPPALAAVDGKLDHGHVGVRRPLWQGRLNSVDIDRCILSLQQKQRKWLFQTKHRVENTEISFKSLSGYMQECWS